MKQKYTAVNAAFIIKNQQLLWQGFQPTAFRLSPEFRFSITQSASVRLSSRRSLADWDFRNLQCKKAKAFAPFCSSCDPFEMKVVYDLA